ncbi:kelch-like protein 24 [Lingula anatina]|uniref:Kelch-like protein 24 n=1 Tax=Lingula anatina TaxID=7574 RepID=A0A1S3H874_LINAN|nr:kelch-like protein 24 [Lingula anatina]|eukprot:XP_013381324.1 kelch-like protein 24 [Lingula anatina]
MDTYEFKEKEVQDPSFAYQMINGIHRLKKANTLSDITIDVAGQKFQCHKVVLASISSYFEVMFTSSMKEEKSAEIAMKGIEPLVFKTILDFTYTGKCKISTENAQAVMDTANMLQIFALIKICGKYIAENLTPQNCLPLWQFADAIDCRELIQKTMHFSLENFLQVPSPLVVSLSKDFFIQYISNDSLLIHSAQIALRWIEAEPERKTDAAEVLFHVRFSMLSSRYMMVFLQHEIVRNNEPILKLIHQAQLFQSDPTMYFELPYPQASPRYSLKRREYVLLLTTTNDSTSSSRQTLSFISPKWVLQKREIKGFGGAAICSSTVNSEVFVSGGKDNPKKLIMYNAELGLQCERELATMLTRRQNHTMVIIGGCLHIIGGLEIVSTTKNVQIGPATPAKQFQPCPVSNQPAGRIFFGTCVPDQPARRNIFGASVPDQPTAPAFTPSIPVTNLLHKITAVSKIEVYNIQQNKWRPAGNLLTGVWQHASVSFQDKVYTFGGTTDISGSLKDATNKVQIYSSQTGECVLGPEIPAAISKCTATVMEESIFIIGLEIEIKPLSNSEEDEEPDPGSDHEEKPVFYQFKPLDGVWIKLNPPTNINSALCTFHGKIWNIVVGSETKVYLYNHQNDVWEGNSDDSEDPDKSEDVNNSVKCMQITY